MNPHQTALVLIEYQNDFTSEGGTLHAAVEPIMKQTHMLANTIETVERTRRSRSRRIITNSPPSHTGSSKASSTASRFGRAPGARRSSTN
jgi:nicotinamidase-related amidase